MDYTIVVPIYNEEENIPLLHRELREVLDKTGKKYEMLFVNDGSKDTSLEKLEQIKNNDPKVKIINFTRNFGQTPAIMAGFDNASGDIIITMDGDLQNDPHDIPALIAEIEKGSDLAAGWRRDRKDNFLFRTFPSVIANFIIRTVIKTDLHDYGCTLKAYRKEILRDMHLYGEMHRFIPAIAFWKGARISEIAVNHRPRKYGKTKYGLSRIMRVIIDLMLLAFLSEYSTKPIRFFGGLSVFSGVLGTISAILLIYMKIAGNVDMTGNPLLIMCALFFMLSIQFISMGFLGEINIRTYYESQGKKTYYIREII